MPRLIGLVGAAQAGKDTAASYLVEDGWTRAAFADALKKTLYDMDIEVNVPGALPPYGWSLKTIVDEDGWEWAKIHVPEVRGYLQKLGVAVRDNVDQDAWLNAAFNKMDLLGSYVVTDCRFPNELDAIKAQGGILVRIERPDHANNAGNHISETAWRDHEFDYTVYNTSTPEWLGECIRDIAWKVSNA